MSMKLLEVLSGDGQGLILTLWFSCSGQNGQGGRVAWGCAWKEVRFRSGKYGVDQLASCLLSVLSALHSYCS